MNRKIKIQLESWYSLQDMVQGRMLADLHGWGSIRKIVQADRQHKNLLAAVITGTGNGMKYRFKGENIIRFKKEWEGGVYRLLP